MNQIINALNSGYGAEEILDYLSKSAPSLSKSIIKAKRFGYQATQILDYLSKSSEENFNPGLSEADMQNRAQQMDAKRAKFGISATASLIATPLLANAAKNIFSGSKNDLSTTPPPIINPPVPNAPAPEPIMPGNNIGQQINNQINQPTNPAQVATAAQAQPQLINQAQQGMKPQGQEQPQSIFEQLLSGVDMESLDPSKKQQLTFLGMIADQLQGQGKTLEDPEFKKLADKVKKTLQGKSGILMQEVSRGITQEENVPQKIEPKSIVFTPQGVGEVKGINKGQAIVEIDGKAHKINEKEIELPPIPEKDLADLHNDLIAGIEKATGQEVSRHVDWVGYDPEANELQYKPWGGTSYTLNNIEPEDVEFLTSILTQRKTTGKNWIGAWDANTNSPIGAAMRKLLEKLKAKAKEKGVKEYTRKYQTVYGAREPAEQAAKLKKKLADQVERKKKKDEEKRKKQAK